MALDPLIEKLLVLQDRDVKRDEICSRLQDIPREIDTLNSRIKAEEAELATVRDHVRQLEVKRRDIETQVGLLEDQRNRFRTQQLSVKKNEEYTALEKEIDTTTGRIGNLESEALEVMMEIDERNVDLKSSEQKTAEVISELKGQIQRLKENEAYFQGQLDGAEAAVATATEGIDKRDLSTYRYVKERVRKPPYVVSIDDQRCSGCHIKVSYEIIKQAQSAGSLTRCDSCGRIVYA